MDLARLTGLCSPQPLHWVTTLCHCIQGKLGIQTGLYASQGGTLLTELSSLLKMPSTSQGSPHQFTVANSDKLTIQIGINTPEGESYNRQRCSRQFLILK